MSIMMVVGTILLAWLVLFVALFIPARAIGRWIAKGTPETAGAVWVVVNVLILATIAKLVVCIGCLVLILGQFSAFPHVNQDPLGFGLFFSGLLIFPPTFGALIFGYLRARNTMVKGAA